MVKKAILVVCLALAPLATGCQAMANNYCTVRCDECGACSDEEYDECVITYQAVVDVAYAYDCSVELDDLYDCILDDPTCIGNELIGDLDCIDESADLTACQDKASSL
jgi:hypothetical protein